MYVAGTVLTLHPTIPEVHSMPFVELDIKDLKMQILKTSSFDLNFFRKLNHLTSPFETSNCLIIT